jgi:hypothetical protein
MRRRANKKIEATGIKLCGSSKAGCPCALFKSLYGYRKMKIKEIIRRVLIGSLMGAFIGLLELWFYEFNLRHGIAAILSGALFGTIVGIFGSSMLKKIATALILCGCAGGLAGAIWWVIAKSSVSIFQSVAIGIALGLLFGWSNDTWNTRKEISVQQNFPADRG